MPGHLKGELPGDYGFDPLKLGANPQALRWCDNLLKHRFFNAAQHSWAMAPCNILSNCCCNCRYQQAELVHCRYAMTAVAGILIPSVSKLHWGLLLQIPEASCFTKLTESAASFCSCSQRHTSLTSQSFLMPARCRSRIHLPLSVSHKHAL